MPERTEVYWIARGLHELYQGKTIISMGIDTRSRYYITDEQRNELQARSGAKATKWMLMNRFNQGKAKFNQMAPFRIVQIHSRGKKIIFDLAVGNSDTASVFLVSFLGMEGRWIPGNPDVRGTHSNLWINIGTKLGIIDVIEHTVYFDDMRHFGSLDFYFSADDLKVALSDLGPDILLDEITPELWSSIVRGLRNQDKQICDFLLDQKRIAGIGNWMRCEIMYRARIRPDRTLGSLTDEEVERLRQVMLQVTQEAVDSHGLTIRTYWDPFGRKGTYECHVYGKTHDPLGNPVVKSTFKDGRTTHWVPAVQGGTAYLNHVTPPRVYTDEDD